MKINAMNLKTLTTQKINVMNLKILTTIILVILFANATNSAHASQFETIVKTGVLRVGVSLFEPWAMKKKDGSLHGFEIQVAKKLARDMGVEPEFVIVDWEKIIDALENKKFDVIIAGMAITPKRALRINFSNPYSSSGISVVANLEKTKNFNSLGELNISKVLIGAVSGTVSEKVAKKVFYRATLETYVHDEDAVKAVVAGDIHALVASSPEPKFLELQYPKKVDVPLSQPLLTYKTGMAVNKGEQEFLNFLNSWITSREAEGWLGAKREYWFDSLKWKTE